MKLLIEGHPGMLSGKEIKKLFCKYGYVEKVEKEQFRNRAMVTMPSENQAAKALNELDGSKVFGRVVRVSKENENDK